MARAFRIYVLYRGYIRGYVRGYIGGYIRGYIRGYIGIMEKKMESTF